MAWDSVGKKLLEAHMQQAFGRKLRVGGDEPPPGDAFDPRPFMPPIPDDWRYAGCVFVPGVDHLWDRRGLKVIVTGMPYQDKKRWIHLSCSRKAFLPSWQDLKDVKATFIGPDKLAIQVLPREDKFVNLYSHVLHLYHCLDGDPIPDFTMGGDTI
jgi:hypothetical protein